MTTSSTGEPETTIPVRTKLLNRSGDLLARCVFTLVVLGLAILLISAAWILLSPQSVIYARSNFRPYVLAGYGIAIVITLLLGGFLLRVRPERLALISIQIVKFLSHPWTAIPLVLILLIVTAQLYLALGDIRSDVGALRLWLLGWAGITLLVVLVANGLPFARWFSQTQRVWAVVGLSLLVLLLLVALLVTNQQLFTGYIEPIFVASSYATTHYNTFAPNSGVDSQRYWLELNTVRETREMPYVEWRSPSFQGEYINVDETGIRRTSAFTKDDEQPAHIFFFGGSTAWGYGARDEYTIPSQFAKTLNESGCPVEVVNLAENGYASAQDRILFEQQIIKGNIPDAAIFYWGYNDIISAYRWNYLSLPMSGFRGLTDTADMALIGSTGHVDPQATADYIARTASLLDVLGEAYGVRIVIIWQPTIFYKPLTPYEQEAYNRGDNGQPGIIAFYKQVDTQIRGLNLTNVTVMSDLFQQHEEPVFIDWAHITEEGNGIVAAEIARQFQRCF